MQIFLDPWNPEFASGVQAEIPRQTISPNVQLDIEMEMERWKSVKPEFVSSDFIFVDGVRRVDSRVILQNGEIHYGLFGSAAAGGMLMGKKRLNLLSESLLQPVVERYLISGANLSLDVNAKIRDGLEFKPLSVQENDADAPIQKLQQLMCDLEGSVISQLFRGYPEKIIIADGPLRFPWAKETVAMGYIKSFHEWYLPMSHFQHLAKLDTGERTPLFLIRGTGEESPDRFGWFVRLSKFGSGDSPFFGLARLEVACHAGLDRAKELAALSCVLFAFTAKKHRDPRSPQNLLPIGALEKNLKHLLGDSLIVQRWIEAWIRKLDKS